MFWVIEKLGADDVDERVSVQVAAAVMGKSLRAARFFGVAYTGCTIEDIQQESD